MEVSMNKKIWLVVIIVICSYLMSCSTTSIILSGKVSDQNTGKPIEKAIVRDGNYGNGNFGITDNEGKYSYCTNCEEHNIEIFAEGYKAERKTVLTPFLPNKNEIVINIELEKE
jgi:hypothetical protein